MNIRKLDIKDAPLMLEWMHDKNVIEFFGVDFSSKTLEDAKEFILNSYNENNQNFAIVDESDEYQGTITLKNIDYKNMNAEYAISIRSSAMGRGISKMATDKILEHAFNTLNLNKVYLCVASDNERAIKFYKKYGFTYDGKFTNHIKRNNKFINLEWYYILKEEGEKKC